MYTDELAKIRSGVVVRKRCSLETIMEYLMLYYQPLIS